MRKVASAEFRRKLEEYQGQAQQEPVEITRDGRRELVLMSADHYDWLRAAAQRKHHTADALDAIIDAVDTAEMAPEHKVLDDLLK
ncbi:prevent-host-death family protein [Neorhizobium huautlense]|uniref:Antitoxin n=1 Tax=Neorhizobium huautlense TaxID=67774 RepID=A0ABT9PP36_9HYPH|nr:type II toxin-antitoxin system prevent-host-death family antitoxin [Neorhizobium huautlense]MDP9836212.1 prevent-host-death family protein [Neorhizobium huautlense]